MPEKILASQLTLTVRDGIAIINLHAPPVNALSRALLEGIASCLSDSSLEDARAVILTGSPDFGFSAGADIAELHRQSPQTNRHFFADLYRIFASIEKFRLPLIAAINRFAMGAGLELALCADIRVMDNDAVLAAAGVNMGLVFGTQRLSRLIGLGPTKDMVLTGRHINADEAFARGLVQYLSTSGQALKQAESLADYIAQKSALSVQGAKRLLHSAGNLPLEEALHLEFMELAATLDDKGFCQSSAAFLDKKRSD